MSRYSVYVCEDSLHFSRVHPVCLCACVSTTENGIKPFKSIQITFVTTMYMNWASISSLTILCENSCTPFAAGGRFGYAMFLLQLILLETHLVSTQPLSIVIYCPYILFPIINKMWSHSLQHWNEKKKWHFCMQNWNFFAFIMGNSIKSPSNLNEEHRIDFTNAHFYIVLSHRIWVLVCRSQRSLICSCWKSKVILHKRILTIRQDTFLFSFSKSIASSLMPTSNQSFFSYFISFSHLKFVFRHIIATNKWMHQHNATNAYKYTPWKKN